MDEVFENKSFLCLVCFVSLASVVLLASETRGLISHCTDPTPADTARTKWAITYLGWVIQSRKVVAGLFAYSVYHVCCLERDAMGPHITPTLLLPYI